MSDVSHLVEIARLAIELRKRNRELYGFETGGNFYAARDSRRALAQVDAELNALIDDHIAAELLAAK